jgi:CheY-like chemotaxis protein
MKILLVEDDEDKREQLASFIKTEIRCELTEAQSFQSALRAIKSSHYDLILLDMTIPTFDITPHDGGGRSQPFGGEMLLHEMLRREIESKVIIVTQFDIFGKGEDEITLKDLDLRLSQQFANYLGAVQYGIAYTGWKDVLAKIIKEKYN